MGWKYYLFVQFNSTSTTFKKPEKGKERGKKEKKSIQGPSKIFYNLNPTSCLPATQKKTLNYSGRGVQWKATAAELRGVPFIRRWMTHAPRGRLVPRARVTCFSRVAVNRVRSGTRVPSPLLICSDVYERAAGASAPPVMHARGSS